MSWSISTRPPVAKPRNVNRMTWRKAVCVVVALGVAQFGCVNSTHTRVEPAGPPRLRRVSTTAPNAPQGISARLHAEGTTTRLRVFHGVSCTTVELAETPMRTVEEVRVGTGGYVWTGVLAGLGLLVLASPKDSDSSGPSRGLAGGAYLLGAGIVFLSAYGRTGKTVAFASPQTAQRTIGSAVCPVAPVSAQPVTVRIGDVVIERTLGVDGMVSVPAPIGLVPWVIEVSGAPVSDVRTE